jgi:hypothetical protein
MSHSFPPPSEALGDDPLKRMRVYQLAHDLIAASWTDAERLKTDIATVQIAGQLYSRCVRSPPILQKVTPAVPAEIEREFLSTRLGRLVKA